LARFFHGGTSVSEFGTGSRGMGLRR
jgi:hypothetical protein